MHLPKRITFTFLGILLALPLTGKGAPEPYQQTFVLTAYYSPLPGQCCYVKGGLIADKILNGEGHHGADGTAVYPGMLAGPPSYAFGTRIDLPGLGVMTVHDRGGAIQEQGKVHRLDVWAGYGEEGLARALAFGVQTITGTVYPVGSEGPLERFSLDTLPAPFERLRAYLVKGDNLMAMEPKADDTALSVLLLQERLKDLGYLTEIPTGFFGAATSEALGRFIADYGLSEPNDRLTSVTAAHLLAVLQRQAGTRTPLSQNVDQEASPQAIKDAQRLLRGLGYYRGRTNGEYDHKLFTAILEFQQDHGLAKDMTSPGAGRIGPITMKVLHDKWNRSTVARQADTYLDIKRLDEMLHDRQLLIDRFLEEGNSGESVTMLQTLLSDLGFFPADQINGNFGSMTRKAVADYQIDRGILASRNDESAGRVGPATLTQLQREQRTKYYRLVRGQGWQVL